MHNISIWIVAIVLMATVSAAYSKDVPANLKSVIKKTQSFGLDHYPVVFWNNASLTTSTQHMNKAAVDDWADAGFTVPMSPYFDAKDSKQIAHISKMLDWCKQHGIKMIVVDPRCSAHKNDKFVASDYEKGFKSVVKDFGTHPALFGFHVGDEPTPEFLPTFSECLRIQKKIAPKLHPFGNLVAVESVPEYRNGKTSEAYLDDYVRAANPEILSYDWYTQMWPETRGSNLNMRENGIDQYYGNLRVFRAASLRNGIPFWNTLLAVGHLAYRCPTLDDIRWQFNTTVCSGANGILWFFYYMVEPNANYRQAPIDEFWKPTQGRYNLGLVQNHFHKVYGDLFNHIVSTKVMFCGKVYGQGKPFAPDSLVSSVITDIPNHPVLIGEFTDIQGQRYVMIVNNSQTTDAEVTVTFPGTDVKVYTWDWNHNEREDWAIATTCTWRSESGFWAQHWLAPGQEAVYRVKSSLTDTSPVVIE